jgi:hypothetical protein
MRPRREIGSMDSDYVIMSHLKRIIVRSMTLINLLPEEEIGNLGMCKLEVSY